MEEKLDITIKYPYQYLVQPYFSTIQEKQYFNFFFFKETVTEEYEKLSSVGNF